MSRISKPKIHELGWSSEHHPSFRVNALNVIGYELFRERDLISRMLAAKSAEAGEDYITFLYSGDIKALLSAVQSLPIYDISITEPSLDEIFMHYYEKRGE